MKQGASTGSWRAVARAKAKLAWRLGQDSQHVQDALPHLLARGETLLGGAVVRRGLVVAASGAGSCRRSPRRTR